MKLYEPELRIGERTVGAEHAPLVIAEIGINHEGHFDEAVRMIEDAARVGCECVKFQCHILDAEMIPNAVVPANAKESIWDIMKRCTLSVEEEVELKTLTEQKGMIYLSTPFSGAAATRLEKMGVKAYKIGSGECNNYLLVEQIAQYGKPVIVSTGMNDIPAITETVRILRQDKVPYALLHCTSLYPTPYERVRLGALKEIKTAFGDAVIGLSDHSLSIYPCLGAVSLGASIIERHFTSDKTWPGPDIPISMDPSELKSLIEGSRAIHLSRGGKKEILAEEKPTIDFAYACVVALKDIPPGTYKSIEVFSNQKLGDPMEVALANTITGLSQFVQRRTPDLVVVHGDRVEALAGAIVGSLRNVLTAHIEGGEVSGTIDGSFRHSISKMCHLHFVANHEATIRLQQLGEHPDSIFEIGSPDIDVMLSRTLPTLAQVKEHYQITFERYGIALFHPVTQENASMERHAAIFVEALQKSGKKYVVIYPNNDVGSAAIFKAMQSLKGNTNFALFPSLRFEWFLTLLKNADVIVGNSSVGIREAPVYGVPSVNIGSRQSGRFQYESIFNTTYDTAQLLGAIQLAVSRGRFDPCMHFGAGNSAKLFMQHLSDERIWKIPKVKEFQDLPIAA